MTSLAVHRVHSSTAELVGLPVEGRSLSKMQKSQSLRNVAREPLPGKPPAPEHEGKFEVDEEEDEEEMVLQFPEGIGIPMSRLNVGSKTKNTPF